MCDVLGWQEEAEVGKEPLANQFDNYGLAPSYEYPDIDHETLRYEVTKFQEALIKEPEPKKEEEPVIQVSKTMAKVDILQKLMRKYSC